MKSCASSYGFITILNGLVIASLILISQTTSLSSNHTANTTPDKHHTLSSDFIESIVYDKTPSIVLKYDLSKIQIGLLESFSVNKSKIFLKGTYGLAILDLDKKETYVKRFRNIFLGVDNEQGIWYLTETSNSIFRWDGKKTVEFGKNQGWILPARFHKPLIPVNSTPLLIAGDNIWLATSNDVRLFNGKTWRVFTATEIGIKLPYKAGVKTNFILAHNSITGDIWAAACYWQGDRQIGGSSPYQFDGNRWYKIEFPFENVCVTHLTFDKNGNGYLITPTTVWKYNGQNWNEMSLPVFGEMPKNSTFRIIHFVLDSFESPWMLVELTNENGIPEQNHLFQYKDTKFTKVSTLEGISTPVFFFTSQNSAIFFKNKKVFQIAPAGMELISDNNFDLIIQDSDENIWLISATKSRPLLWLLGENQTLLKRRINNLLSEYNHK